MNVDVLALFIKCMFIKGKVHRNDDDKRMQRPWILIDFFKHHQIMNFIKKWGQKYPWIKELNERKENYNAINW